jgi:uncharacterized damage-inducible protein DinB
MRALSLILFVLPGTARAQTAVEVRGEMLRQFNASMGKIIALANAMPAESYTWSPGEGVMEVGHVYMHIARYNYLYPTQSLQMALPEGVELVQMESLRDKDRVLAALEASREWVRESIGAMGAEGLEQETQLYGRSMPGWAVLVQLVAHMNEHVGQSIAYARMNGVVPPWSR